MDIFLVKRGIESGKVFEDWTLQKFALLTFAKIFRALFLHYYLLRQLVSANRNGNSELAFFLLDKVKQVS